MAKKAEFAIKVKKNDKMETIEDFTSKQATKAFNKLPQGSETHLFIKENNMGEQYVGPYITRGLPNEPEEPSNKPPVIDVTSPIEVKQHTDVTLIAHITDVDGTVEDVVWKQTAGPTVTFTTMDEGTNYSLMFHAHEIVTYKFSVEAHDNLGGMNSKEVVVKCVEIPVDHHCAADEHWDEATQMCVKNEQTGDVLWDSNTDGKWNDGNKRTITIKQGNQQPNDKSIFVAASGNPKLDIDGDGVAHLVGGTGEFDNLSLKLRSRHQAGGSCENRFGGFGCSFDRSSIDMKTESCHNFHENTIGGNHAGVKNGEWHKFRFDVKDTTDGKVWFNVWLDGKHVKEGFHNNPKPYYLDEKTFMALSWFWIRGNNSDHPRIYVCACNYNASLEGEWMFEAGKPSIALRNIVLKKI